MNRLYLVKPFMSGMLLLLLLSSCSNIHSSLFDCPPAKGMGCQSTARINKAIDDHLFSSIEDEKNLDLSKEIHQEEQVHRSGTDDNLTQRTLRLWLPKKEKQGLLQEGHYIEVPIGEGETSNV